MRQELAVEALRPGMIVAGPLLPEPVEIIAILPLGGRTKLIGKGLRTNQVREPIRSPAQLAQLVVSPSREPFDPIAGRMAQAREQHDRVMKVLNLFHWGNAPFQKKTQKTPRREIGIARKRLDTFLAQQGDEQ